MPVPYLAPSSQLRYDGYETAAQSVSHLISSFPPTSPSSRLSHLVQLGLRTEGEGMSLLLKSSIDYILFIARNQNPS